MVGNIVALNFKFESNQFLTFKCYSTFKHLKGLLSRLI